MANNKQIYKLNSAGLVNAMIIHDLGNPINNISAISRCIEKNTNNPELIKEMRADLTNELNRLEGMYRNIRKMSCNEPLTLSELNLEIVISSIAKLHEQHLGCLNINIDGAIKVKSDPFALTQIVNNLVKNAFDATPNATVSIEAHEDTDSVALIVRDNGQGMSVEQTENIFGNFSSNEDSPEIRGLGLQVVKELSSQINARIECISSIGNGTSFSILLPK